MTHILILISHVNKNTHKNKYLKSLTFMIKDFLVNFLILFSGENPVQQVFSGNKILLSLVKKIRRYTIKAHIFIQKKYVKFAQLFPFVIFIYNIYTTNVNNAFLIHLYTIKKYKNLKKNETLNTLNTQNKIQKKINKNIHTYNNKKKMN